MSEARGYYRSLFELSGRVAVVTGGSGLLGKHFCRGLADFGARVAVIDLDGRGAKAFAQELQETFGPRCIGLVCDVTDPKAVTAMANEVQSKLGPICILHNNAATKGGDLNQCFAPLEDYALDTWREIMAVDLDGIFIVAKEIGGRMAQAGRGSIIQMASVYGVVAPDQRIYEGSKYLGRAINCPPVYSAAKAGIIGLTRHLAAYWAHRGVRVNTLTPGGVSSGQNETFDRRYSARVPMDRMAKANEMVGALIFLASDASSYLNGQNIIVDGGLTAW